MMQRASVDLPHPVSPTRPSVSPRRISRLTPSTAWTTSSERRNRLVDCTGKCLTTLSTRSRTSPEDAASPLTLNDTSLSLRDDRCVALEHVGPDLLPLLHVGGEPARRHVVGLPVDLQQRRLFHAL